jgi:hypothetical protein
VVVTGLKWLVRDEMTSVASGASVIFGAILGVIIAEALGDRDFSWLQAVELAFQLIAIAGAVMYMHSFFELIAIRQISANRILLQGAAIIAGVAAMPFLFDDFFVRIQLWYATMFAWAFTLGIFAYLFSNYLQKSEKEYTDD